MKRLRMTALVLASVSAGGLLAACGGAPEVSTSDGEVSSSNETNLTMAELGFEEGGDKFVAAANVGQAIDSGLDVVFVDARPSLDFDFGHIPGAINVPYFEVEAHMDSLPRDKWIVTYCECPHAEAEQAADILLAGGFSKVKVMDDGLAAWREMGGEYTDDGGGPTG